LEQGEEDLKRTGIAAVVASGVVLALQGQFLHEHWQSAMWFTFALGYIGIIFEEVNLLGQESLHCLEVKHTFLLCRTVERLHGFPMAPLHSSIPAGLNLINGDH
jgi:hypothetical protein